MNPLFVKLEALGFRSLGDPNEQIPVSQSDIEDLERDFGFPFPPLYKEFLLCYGASSFYDVAFFDAPEDWAEKTDGGAPNDVRAFYGINKEREYGGWSLKAEINGARSGGLPPYFLPICSSDSLPTIVYLSCRPEDYGHAYALTHTQSWDLAGSENSVETAQSNAFHIANSFENFISSLHVVSPEELFPSSEIEPLFVAIHAGDVSFLQRMVDAGEAETFRSKYDSTLMESVVTSHLAWPVELLLKHEVPIGNAFWLAIENGCLDAIRLFIAHGVDVNTSSPPDRLSIQWYPPIIQAVRSDLYEKKYDMVQMLVDAGADVAVTDSKGKTAWDYINPRNQKMRDILSQATK